MLQTFFTRTTSCLVTAGLLGSMWLTPSTAVHASALPASSVSATDKDSIAKSSITGTNAASLPASSSPKSLTAMNALHKSWTSSNLRTPSVLIRHASNSFVSTIHAVPAKKLVYAYVTQLVDNTPKARISYDWRLDSLKALDENTGKVKWTYNFHKSGGPFTIYSETAFAANGTTYAFQNFTDSTYKLYSINSSGKLNWTRSLPHQNGLDIVQLSVMKDNSILAAVQYSYDNKGIYHTELLHFQASGKLIHRSQIAGRLIRIQNEHILMDLSPMVRRGGIWDTAYGSKLAVYNQNGQQQYTCQMPKATILYEDMDEQQTILSDGSIIIREAGSTQDKLYGFSLKGKLLWKRLISIDAQIAASSAGYAVYQPASHTISLYIMNSQIVQQSVVGPPEEGISLIQTIDGNLLLTLQKSAYVLNPQNLQTIFASSSGNILLNADIRAYSDGAIYTADARGGVVKWSMHP
ncbi:PQQ-binding-like beta-propeller repeat protein [Paenibacillus shenyangensis]|uniref:PQQ-binding-like beta-propeller repeat protein n=1 Tax=Paenibacillus sp. A9 TaxID=1284352 RepID=UPI000365C76A|nr:PQQ-binding-like beta-propeller repeat protein [Paenibacillus sp. A9]